MTNLIYLPRRDIHQLTKDDEVGKRNFVICILKNTKFRCLQCKS